MSDVDERLEHDRGLRTALLVLEELRADLTRLAAQVVAQGEALTRVMATLPVAAPGADAEPAATAAIAAHDAALAARTAELDAAIRARDVTNVLHVELAPPVDKYAALTSGPPCAEILPVCGARCCRLTFALSSQDLEEGVIRWDHGRPYLMGAVPEMHLENGSNRDRLRERRSWKVPVEHTYSTVSGRLCGRASTVSVEES